MASLEASSPEALDFSELQAQTKTSVDVFRCLIGRGNLNRSFNLLIIKDYLRFYFLLEYLLEYQLRMSLDSRLYLDKCPIP